MAGKIFSHGGAFDSQTVEMAIKRVRETSASKSCVTFALKLALLVRRARREVPSDPIAVLPDRWAKISKAKSLTIPTLKSHSPD